MMSTFYQTYQQEGKNMSLFQRLSKKLIFIYPPYRGAGIRIYFNKEETEIIAEMNLKWYNRNYVGTHFGGSLYSMCDPHFMWLLIDTLGRDYIIWDKSATIHFKKPATGRVRARFHIPEEEYQEIRAKADQGDAVYPVFTASILNEKEEVVALVEKELYVKKKSNLLHKTSKKEAGDKGPGE